MRRSALLTLAAGMVLYALFFARPHPTPGPPMRDFEAYYAAGTAWRHGIDPYGTMIWQTERTLPGVAARRNELLPFVGPPASLPVWAAFSRLSFYQANALWRTLLLISLALLAFVALRLAGIPLTLQAALATIIFSLGFGPVTSSIALGQVALPAYAFAAFALLWPAAAVCAWIQPNVAIALASQVLRKNGALVFAATAALFALGCAIVGGTSGLTHYATILKEHAGAERFSAIQITPAAIAYGFGAGESTAQVTGTLAATAAIIAWAYGMYVLRDNIARFCATCALLPFAIQFFHEHDLVVLFIPALFLATRCSARVWPAACVAALFCATDWIGLAQRPDGASQTVLLVGAAGIALFAMRGDLPLRALFAPAGVLVVIGIAAAYAQTHPAPVWPDAMRASPVALNGNAAHVWHAEQAASGLLEPDIFWALLRCGSLAGCAALAYAGLINSIFPARSKSPLRAPA